MSKLTTPRKMTTPRAKVQGKSSGPGQMEVESIGKQELQIGLQVDLGWAERSVTFG